MEAEGAARTARLGVRDAHVVLPLRRLHEPEKRMEKERGVTSGRIVGARTCTRTGAGSLLVSFLPAERRVCTFDCTYCTFRCDGPARWPRASDIGIAVANALHRTPNVDSITVSGSGEPTLHPDFGMALGNVLWARQVRSDLPVRIATNGATLLRPGMRRILQFADELVVRVDAGSARIDRPGPRSPLGAIVASLTQLSDFSVESVFVDGPGGNTDEESIREWLGLLGELQPRRVYVTTIAAMPVETGVRRAGPTMLETIAARVRDRAGPPAAVVA